MKSIMDVPSHHDQDRAWVLRCAYNGRYFYCLSSDCGPVTVARIMCERFTTKALALTMLRRIRAHHVRNGSDVRWSLVRLRAAEHKGKAAT